MKPCWAYFAAALLGMIAPLLGSSEQTHLGLFYRLGAVPLGILSVALGATCAVHRRADVGEAIIASVWMLAVVALCVPVVAGPAGALFAAQLVAAGAAATALLAAGVRAARSGLPRRPRLLRVAALFLVAVLFAREGLRMYSSLHESASAGIGAMVAEANLFAVVVLIGAALLAVSAATERRSHELA